MRCRAVRRNRRCVSISTSAASRSSAARSPGSRRCARRPGRRRRGDPPGAGRAATCSRIAPAIAAAVVLDVDHVGAALAPLLPRADVHGRHAEERALADRHARVADDRRRVAPAGAGSPPGTCCGTGGGCPASRARGRRGCPSTCRRSRRRRSARTTAPAARTSFTAYSVSSTCCARLLVLGRHRMLHDDEIALREIGRRADAAVLLERIEVERRAAPRPRRRCRSTDSRSRPPCSGASPSRMHALGAPASVETRCRFDSLVTACRTFSSIEPVTSPPCTCTTGMFMYDAATAVASVS